ncbi:MAG: PF05951 family [Trebouxia sp. A1-2]|nr:MAG: PF05951 family [Trebouxia sp. A1-2]
MSISLHQPRPATVPGECPLGSGTVQFKMAGEVLVKPHESVKTGYKAPNAYGAKPIFSDETTNKHYQKMVHAVGAGQGTHKKLEKYHPNAPRNRPKETMENVVGNRHKLHPCIKHEKYRGSSQIRFSDGDPDSRRPWKTTNQACKLDPTVFSKCAQVQDTVGLANCGISSSVAKDMHKKQGIYGTAAMA